MAKPSWYNWVAPITNLGRSEGDPKTVDLVPDKTPEQLQAMRDLGGVVTKYLPQYDPGKEWGGQYSAPLTRPEVKSTSLLNQYLDSSPTGTNYDAASRQLQATLSGGYNPSTSPFYDSMRQASQVALQDQLDASRRDAGARGSYFTEGAQRDESRLRSDANNQLNQVLGQIYEAERQRQFQGIGLGKELDAYQNLARTGQIQAGMNYGSLERTVQDADLAARYNDFMRQQQERAAVPGIAQNLAGTSITYGQQQLQQPNSFQQIISALAPLAGSVAGGMMGGPFGATVGGQAGNMFSQAAMPANYGIRPRSAY